jgi:hypothetical protein
MPKATPSKKSSVKKSNIFVRAVNKFSSLHAPAKVLILALIIGVFGGGSYAVYMSSAAGWTYMGQKTYYDRYSSSSITINAYSCKRAVPKQGYQIKSMGKILKVTGTKPSSYKYSVENGLNVPGPANYTLAWIQSPFKQYKTVYSAYNNTYGTLDTKIAVNIHSYQSPEGTGVGTINEKRVRDLSTCP